MDLSIVIINWNTRQLLADCLKALPQAVAPYSHETWVVDNGSTDGSVAMVRQDFPSVRLIENQTNRGFAAANNQALSQASGRFLLLLNSDTVAMAGSLARLIRSMEENPKLGIVGAQLLNADGSLQNSASVIPNLATELGNKSLLKRLNPRKHQTKFDAQRYDAPVAVESVIGACLMIRRETMQQIGLLDEGFFFFLEETDWCLRAKQAGWSIACEPRAKVYHLQGGSAKPVRAEARIEYWRSRYRFFEKHASVSDQQRLGRGLRIRLHINQMANAIGSLFSAKSKHKKEIADRLLAWHRAGCPADGGLQKRGKK